MVTVVTYLEKWLCKAKKHVTSGVVTRWIRVVTMTEEKTMDFKQIEHSVLKFEPMPDNAPLHEQMCYFALRHLYEDYRRGVVNGLRMMKRYGFGMHLNELSVQNRPVTCCEMNGRLD